MKDKARKDKAYHKLEDAKQTQKLNVIQDLGLDLRT